MARPASIAPAPDARHASYTHIVLHATPLPVAIIDTKRESSLSTGDGIAIASAIIAIVTTIFAWRAVALAKRSLQESQRATLATLAAAKVTQEEAEYLRNERSRRPNLIAHFEVEPITISIGDQVTAQINRNGTQYRLVRFTLTVENDGTCEAKITTTRFRVPAAFLNWIEVEGVSRASFMGELSLPAAVDGSHILSIVYPQMIGIGTNPILGSGRCWVPVAVDHTVEWQALSERDRFPLDGSWGALFVRVDAEPNLTP